MWPTVDQKLQHMSTKFEGLWSLREMEDYVYNWLEITVTAAIIKRNEMTVLFSLVLF